MYNMLGNKMIDKCPIVKIMLPYADFGIAHMYYCDKHSITVDISPMNEYQIERLKEEALLGMQHKGCIIPCEIKEYEFYDWLENKEKYLNPKGDKNAVQRYVGISADSQNQDRRRSFSSSKSCHKLIVPSHAEISERWLGYGFI